MLKLEGVEGFGLGLGFQRIAMQTLELKLSSAKLHKRNRAKVGHGYRAGARASPFGARCVGWRVLELGLFDSGAGVMTI